MQCAADDATEHFGGLHGGWWTVKEEVHGFLVGFCLHCLVWCRGHSVVKAVCHC